MKTVLDRVFRDMLSDLPGSLHGLYREQEHIHNEAARKHFLKYCDSDKCIRGREHSMKHNWHCNGFCQECAFNPYNMVVKDAANGEGSDHDAD